MANNKKSECDICGQMVVNLRQHTRFIHGDLKQFKCELCDKQLKTQDALKLHQVVHNTSETFKCELCQSILKRAADLKVHMRIHSASQPHKCELCDKVFNNLNHKKIICFHTLEQNLINVSTVAKVSRQQGTCRSIFEYILERNHINVNFAKRR